MKSKIASVMPKPQIAPAPAVTFALSAALAKQSVMTSWESSVPQEVLGSSLSAWSCSSEAREYQKRHGSTRSTMAGTKRLRQKTPKEAGGEHKLCTGVWDGTLPVLHTVATIGNDPAASKRPPASKSSQEEGVTFVTQVPITRLHLLEDQCRLWPGLPMAAAIYIPMVNGRVESYVGIDAALAEVLQMGTRLENSGLEAACSLRAEVVYEEMCGEAMPEPTNALRNRALALATTRAVFLADGQHLVSLSFSKALKNKYVARTLLEAAEVTAGVAIPALAPTNPWFGRVAKQIAVETASSKFLNGVINQIRSKQLQGPLGWGLDDRGQHEALQRWQYSRERKTNFTQMGDGAAPQALMMASRVPWFDERQRGGAWAQALHVRHAEALAGTDTWATFGGAWAVRLAPVTEEVGSQGGAAQERSNELLFKRSIGAVVKGKYVPTVGVQELCYS